MCMCLNKYNCTVLMNPSLRLYLYQCFNIAYNMSVTMILKLVHTLLYPSISYCAHVKKKMLAVGGLCPSKTLGLATPLPDVDRHGSYVNIVTSAARYSVACSIIGQ